MNNNIYLSESLKRAVHDGTLLEETKKVIFNIVKKSLLKIYGTNISIRCLQSSIGIIDLLAYFKIDSVLVEGAACFAVVYGIIHIISVGVAFGIKIIIIGL